MRNGSRCQDVKDVRHRKMMFLGAKGAKTHGASGNRAHYGFDDVDDLDDKAHSDISLAGDRSAALHYLAGQKAVKQQKGTLGQPIL